MIEGLDASESSLTTSYENQVDHIIKEREITTKRDPKKHMRSRAKYRRMYYFFAFLLYCYIFYILKQNNNNKIIALFGEEKIMKNKDNKVKNSLFK